MSKIPTTSASNFLAFQIVWCCTETTHQYSIFYGTTRPTFTNDENNFLNYSRFQDEQFKPIKVIDHCV